MVNELSPVGFFAEGASLVAWDSIAGHSTGLGVLAKLLGSGRYQTTTEQLTIPYRNGILHGMDLGYDNKLVAAKAWAALFAAREWALRAEQRQLGPQPPKPAVGWRQLFRQIADVGVERRRLEAWKPRKVQIGTDIPTSGAPDAYDDGTPERRVAEFLEYWRARNFGWMARCLPHHAMQGKTLNRIAGESENTMVPSDWKASPCLSSTSRRPL